MVPTMNQTIRSLIRKHPFLLGILLLAAYVLIFGWMALVHVAAWGVTTILWLIVVLDETDIDEDDFWLGGPRAV